MLSPAGEEAADERRDALWLGRPEDVPFERRLAVPAGEDRRVAEPSVAPVMTGDRRHIASSRSCSRRRSIARASERPAVSSRAAAAAANALAEPAATSAAR
jgi:hypothetical protein